MPFSRSDMAPLERTVPLRRPGTGIPLRPAPLQARQGPLCERHDVIPPAGALLALHPRRRDGPKLLSLVDLFPLAADGVAGPGRGQDGELQGAGVDALLGTKLRHEGRQLRIGQRRVVLDGRNLGFGRQ